MSLHSSGRENIQFHAGLASDIGPGAYTVGVLFRPSSGGNTPLWNGYQADNFSQRAGYFYLGDIYPTASQFGGWVDSNLPYANGPWYWIIMTKPSIGSLIRYHYATYTSGSLAWTHVDGVGNPQNPEAVITTMTIGDPFGTGFQGDISVLAGYTRELTDLEVEAAFTQKALDTYNQSPQFLMLAPQASASSPITEVMNNQLEISRTAGWTAGPDPTGYDFSLSPSGPSWSLWTGTEEVPLTAKLWNGSAEVGLTTEVAI